MKFLRLTAHFLFGLTIGMSLYAVHMYYFASEIKKGPELDTALTWGLLWPALASLYTTVNAWRKPWIQLNPWLATPVIIILLPLSVAAILFVLFLIAFAGYC